MSALQPPAQEEASKPLVWILIVTWNGKADTLACLASLRNIHYRPYKVLVIDNASSDGSVEAIRKHFPETRLVVNAKKRTFCARQ